MTSQATALGSALHSLAQVYGNPKPYMGNICGAAAWKADTRHAMALRGSVLCVTPSHGHLPLHTAGKSRRSARPASQFFLPPVRNRTFPRPTGARVFYSFLSLSSCQPFFGLGLGIVGNTRSPEFP